MAKVDIKMPEEFLQRISRLGLDFDPVAKKVLEAGGEIISEHYRESSLQKNGQAQRKIKKVF